MEVGGARASCSPPRLSLRWTCNIKKNISEKNRAGVSAKIFETETLTLRDRDETETLSKNSRRDRDLNVPRPKRDTRLLKPNVYNILQIILTLNFGHLVNFPTHCNIDF